MGSVCRKITLLIYIKQLHACPFIFSVEFIKCTAKIIARATFLSHSVSALSQYAAQIMPLCRVRQFQNGVF